MSDYDPSELIGVCDSILEDGELSGDELYRLAEWLNDHRDACLHWPGNLLVKPLQEVWADGNITKTELREMSRLLLRIRKQWAKIEMDDALDQQRETAEQIVSALDLSRPELPSIPLVLRVKSHTSRGVFYEVDLRGPNCQCPDWKSFRGQLPLGHLTRCCKHVFDAFGVVEPETGWPGWLGAFMDFSWPPHPKQNWILFSVGGSTVLASTAPKGWADVFSDGGGVYERYGYNIAEHRWAYTLAPRAEHAIINEIVKANRWDMYRSGATATLSRRFVRGL